MKFIIDNIWLIGIVLVSGGALIWPLVQKRGNTVSLLQATQLINQSNPVILDVRDASEFAAGHVRDARNIPLKELPNRVGELDKFKSKPVIVVCAGGNQSPKATSQLKKSGFSEVYVLAGGLAAWRLQGLPTAK